MYYRHRATVLCIALHGNHLASGSRDKSVKGKVLIELPVFYLQEKVSGMVCFDTSSLKVKGICREWKESDPPSKMICKFINKFSANWSPSNLSFRWN